MTVFIDIDVDDSAPRGAMDRLEDALRPDNLERWLKSTAQPLMQRRAKANFKAERDPTGAAWAPMSPATQKIRAAAGFPPQPLMVRTGELHRYITGSPFHTTALPDGAMLTAPGQGGSAEAVKKFKAAQHGTKQNPWPNAKPTPARPVLGLTPRDGRTLGHALQDMLEARVDKRTPVSVSQLLGMP